MNDIINNLLIKKLCEKKLMVHKNFIGLIYNLKW